MRINLLPPEILERRKAERRVGWVVLAAVLVAVVLAGVWAFGFFRLEDKNNELASVKQKTQAISAQADQLRIFEERASELEIRRQKAALALAGRRNWAKLFDEVSLVMPSDIWIQAMSGEETDGLNVAGYAVDAPTDSPDLGHKTMAKTLVRLADLAQLSDVWLASSMKADFLEQPTIQFILTADVAAAEGETP